MISQTRSRSLQSPVMKKPAFALVLTALGALASAVAGASWTDLARGADLAIVGRCDSRTSRWENGGIYSYCETAVLRIVRGAEASTLVVRQRGGEVDGIAQKVTHMAMMEPGRSYLLFLAHDDTGSWSPTSKGVNPISETPDAGETVGGEPLEEVIRALGGAN